MSVSVVLGAFIAGLLIAPYAIISTQLSWLLISGLLICDLILSRRIFFNRFSFFCSCFLIANLLYPLQFKSNISVEQADASGYKFDVTGTILDVQMRSGDRSQVDLQITSLSAKTGALESVEPFKLRLYLEEQSDRLLPGDTLKFSGRIRKPRLFGTPGEFHWPRYLASQGIEATSWVKNVVDVQIKPSSKASILSVVAGWKNLAREFIQLKLDSPHAILTQALILGEGRSLPDETRKLLATAGISHLFAISGLHLGLLALFGYRLLLTAYRRFDCLLLWQPPQRVLPLLMLPPLFIYLIFTGDAVATRRAFSLALLVALLLIWRRNVHPMRLLITLALLFLLLNPLLLWQPAWQLSFAGAAGIILWRPFWQDRIKDFPSYIRRPVALLSVTFAAVLATSPLVIFSFHLFAPAGLLANLFCVPLVTLVALPVGLLGLLLIPVVPDLSQFCFQGAGHVLQLVLDFSDWLTALPCFAGQYYFWTDRQYLALAIFLLPLLVFWQLKTTWQRVGVPTVSLLVGLALLVPLSEQLTSLTMLSVGQGESLLLRNRHQQAILVDGGGAYSPRFDVGERLLAPALGALGVERLTAVVLTHDHPDHRKGLLFVLEHFSVEQFWAQPELSELDWQLQQTIKSRGIEYRKISAGWTTAENWKTGKLMTFHTAETSESKNDASLVIYLYDGGNGLLLTGDLERTGVERLLETGFSGDVSLLKLPHHGSRYSGTEQLLTRLQPRYSLVSAGYNNRYHLPAKQLVGYLEQAGIPLFRTDIHGTVYAESTSNGWRLTSWQNGLFR